MSATVAETPSPTRDRRRVAVGLSGIWQTIETLFLSLWLGGLLIIGAVVAPVAFHALRTAPILADNTALQNALAGSIVGGSLRVLNYIAVVSAVILAPSLHRIGPKAIAAYAIAVAIIIAQQWWLFPDMDLAQVAGNMKHFDSDHALYVNLTYLQLVELLIYAYFRNIASANPVSAQVNP